MPNEVLPTEVPTAELSDEEIVKLVLSGNIDAFGTIVKRHEKRLLRTTVGILRNREDGEDALQEGFSDALRNIHMFNGESLFSTWLFRCVANKALMLYRKRSGPVERNTFSIDAPINGKSSKNEEARLIDFEDQKGTSPEKTSYRLEMQAILGEQIDKLSPTLRTAFVLRHVEGYSLAETAQMLRINENTVKARVWRARDELKVLLADFVSSHNYST